MSVVTAMILCGNLATRWARNAAAESVKAVVEREAGAPAVDENDRFVVLRENVRAGIFRAHSLVGRRLAGLPFGDRLATDAIPLGENGVFLLARLDRSTDPWRRRRTGVCLRLCRSASFSHHSLLPQIAAQRHHAPKALMRFVRRGGKAAPPHHLRCEPNFPERRTNAGRRSSLAVAVLSRQAGPKRKSQCCRFTPDSDGSRSGNQIAEARQASLGSRRCKSVGFLHRMRPVFHRAQGSACRRSSSRHLVKTPWLRLAQPRPGTAAVGVDELDPGGFKTPPHHGERRPPRRLTASLVKDS